MLKELILAIRAYFTAHRFILQHKLWKWMIIPGIIYAYLFLVGMNYFSQYSSLFIESIILRTGLKSWVDNLSSDLIGFFITMGSFWLSFTLLLFYFALFKYLFLFLFAPYFSYFHLRIEAINKNEVFKPYKDLCAKIAEVISSYKPDYKYPRSLSTTLIETSHHQQYFSVNLPKLTDADSKNDTEFTSVFIEDFLFKVLA